MSKTELGVGDSRSYNLDLVYDREVEFYVRVITALVGLVDNDKHIAGRTITVLAAMCYMYSEGVSLKKNARLLEIMDDNGLGRIGGGTLLNYKAKLTKKAWLIRTGSRLDLMPLLKGMCDTNSFDLRLAFLETEGE